MDDLALSAATERLSALSGDYGLPCTKQQQQLQQQQLH